MNNKVKAVIFATAIIVLAAGGVWLLKKKADAHKISSITSADRVEVFRIDAYNLNGSASEYIGNYPVIGKSSITKPKSKEQLMEFIRPYLEDRSYRPDVKTCKQRPGLAFRVWQGENYLDVLVCVSCELLTIEEPYEEWHDFAEDRPLIIGLAKQAFPQDKVVQALSEKEHTQKDYRFEHGS